jgi:hypothetical protein
VKTLAPSHIAEGATADLYQVTVLHRNNRLVYSADNGDRLFLFLSWCQLASLSPLTTLFNTVFLKKIKNLSQP